MNWYIPETQRNLEEKQLKVIAPIPTDPVDKELLASWKDHFDKNSDIIYTFFELVDPVINNMMRGARGRNWDYEPISKNEKWPYQIVVYKIEPQLV